MWLAAAVLVGLFAPMPQAGAADTVRIEVLSNRADLLSGGDALVEVVGPAGTSYRVDVDGRDVTSSFGDRGGRFIGLVEGLKLGANVLTATLAGASAGARITLTNHPIGGPVFSGPQVMPWGCFEGATDAQCNRPPEYDFFYKSSEPGASGLDEYDPENPPSDVATTTTDQGNTVPFIVREEVGAIDRDEYRIAVLFDPSKPWAPWAPQPGYNHKLVITHGASCDTHYEQAGAPDVLNEAVLGKGFAVMSHALDNAGHNCNIVTEAESLVMTKEYLIDHYGEVRYTIGSGCSGGSLVQYQVANAYPGIYQGITPACSFPDAWSQTQYEDYHLLRDYFENPSGWGAGVAWPVAQQALVNGHPNPSNPVTFTTVIPDKGYPNRDCPGVEADQLYDPDTNPDGVRCTFQDYMVNVFGRRPGDGFARRPWDNVGVQYGLQPLLDGLITAGQFADINSKIGGRTIDHEYQQAREEADLFALDAMYRSGAVNGANHLDEVAIIDLRGPDPGAFHDVYRTYAMEARLQREQGHTDNMLLWRGPIVLLADTTFVDDSIFALDKWLAAVEADTRDVPLAQKLREKKPADVTDRCTNGAGVDVPAASCDGIVQSYSTPRMEAGGPLTDDVMKCALKPLNQADYEGVTFSAAEWAVLGAIFPTGVCDYTKAGVSQQDTVAWMGYSDGPGGKPLGDAPRSASFGDSASAAGGGASGPLPATGSGTRLLLVLGAAFVALSSAFRTLRNKTL
jgi:Tannase-like family of unknown function (DUF6351)